jgi:hypothetical protein
MSNQKKLNFASIVIILVSILLILTGLFLLNKSGVKSNETVITTSSISAISTREASRVSESSISTISSVNDSLSSSSASTISSISTSSATSSTSSSSSQKKDSKLSSSEAVVKVIAITNSQYEIEVLDTGYVDGKVWKVGNKFKISLSNFSADKDKEYKLSGLVENGNSSRFDLIEENK